MESEMSGYVASPLWDRGRNWYVYPDRRVNLNHTLSVPAGHAVMISLLLDRKDHRVNLVVHRKHRTHRNNPS
jgi:hypothetical protein